MVSKEWANLSENEKIPYQKVADEKYSEWMIELKEY